MSEFVHLHCHTQYSLLDGASSIEDMMDKAVRDGQKGVALTDHGNMFGAFKFVNEAQKRGIKPIVGCEFYMVEDRHKQSFSRAKGERDKRYHQLMIAKNATGYKNLSKLCSLGFIEGKYMKFPRIDKELIEKYHEGIIATSCCIGAEIPQTIIRGEEEKAEEKLKWWLDIFGDDYYIEIMRHAGLEDITIPDGYGRRKNSGYSQEDVNQVLLKWAEKYNVKVIATNDSHYVEEDDWMPHDILLCLNTGNKLSDPIGEGRHERFGFSSSDYYFKTTEEMSSLFSDVPQAVHNTMEIHDKVDQLKLARDVVLPQFTVPEEFKNQDEYLRHITFEGAKKRYGEITAEVEERLNFELSVIKDSGYPGYFLIVQDFTNTAHKMGVSVGPGRGSAAGSAVAYCLGITNIDPIKYDLLFERFLNPERISMPDIDIDFDDEGRQKVLDYVVDKYGKNQVAQIITYGTMKAKSAVRDVGRVMDVPLSEVNHISKLIPDTSLAKIFDDSKQADLKKDLKADEMEAVNQLREMASKDDNIGKMLKNAQRLEGSVRNTGIHACGVVITPEEVYKYIPVTRSKDNDLLVSQFDNSVAEDAGLLKMDFLGLKTLTIIRDAIQLVKENHNVEIDSDDIPLDDPETYELFQSGQTVGIFQFESLGMQKHMKNLKPTEFNDLIAMNALYRPGPMDYIEDFIARKHGEQEITYDLPEMEEYLKETYGITVYQEQVMLISQKIASFTRGQADSLRKAMGKKKKKVLDELYPLFLNNGKENGHPEETLKKIWKDWEAFASYAFNKSHSTCYTSVAFTTAYLKAHYPAEFMASVLTHNKSDLSKVSFFLRETKKMGIPIHSPHVNTSRLNFTVNNNGGVVMGLSAIKGVGEGPVNAIIEARNEDGEFEDIYDFSKRVDTKSVNKRVMTALALSGALDNLGLYRSQFIVSHSETENFITEIIKYGAAFQEETHAAIQSLFAGMEDSTIEKPIPPEIDEYNHLEKLEKEKEVTGLYVSGHPLDDYELEFRLFTNGNLSEYDKFEEEEAVLKAAGIITEVIPITTSRGDQMGKFTIQDFHASHQFTLFTSDYQRFKHLLEVGKVISIAGQFEKNKYSKRTYFKFKKMNLLSEEGIDKLNSIVIKLDHNSLHSKTIHELDHMIRVNEEGEHEIEFEIDNGDNSPFRLKSANRKTNINMDLINGLKELGVSFNLN